MKPKQIIRKEPFKRIFPSLETGGLVNDSQKVEAALPENVWTVIPQERLLSELEPSGHEINMRPNRDVYDENNNLVDSKEVAKIAVPLQKVIATKQKVHLASNPISFVLTEDEVDKKKEDLFTQFKQAWADKNMHVALSDCIGSKLETGDAAMYFYRKDKELYRTTFSFHKGDVLLPHYDKYGELIVFGRMYKSVDENGKDVSNLEVFDKTNVITYVKKGFLGFNIGERWREVDRSEHGFSVIPICYIRGKDACWGDVQPLIEAFEEAVSNLSENNRYYANMILFLKGTIKDLPNRDDAGKILVGKDDADAKFLASPESSTSQSLELEMLLKQIFTGSFTVSISPDTVKSSGDLPGITVKLLFSPAIEKALESTIEWDSFIDKMVFLFKEGYGIESVNSLGFSKLKLRGSIDVYIPQNDEEIVRMINDSVFAKSISRQTATEKNPLAVNNEIERVTKQIAVENAGSLDVE